MNTALSTTPAASSTPVHPFSVAGHGRLTNDELVAAIEAARKAEIQRRREASRHFGTVGGRVGVKAPKGQPKGVELRYEGHYATEGMYGWSVLIFLRRVDDGAAVVWKTSALLPNRGDGTRIEKGETFRAAFTIKAHTTYQGSHPTAEQQTIVSRLKVY